jgi:hypothetical protein
MESVVHRLDSMVRASQASWCLDQQTGWIWQGALKLWDPLAIVAKRAKPVPVGGQPSPLLEKRSNVSSFEFEAAAKHEEVGWKEEQWQGELEAFRLKPKGTAAAKGASTQ